MYNLLIIFSFFITSFYSLQFTDTDSNAVSMSSYQGKKILLVNVASNSSKIGQLSQLQQLHQTYGDSVVIIAFPSNSFNNEPRSNAEIKLFFQNNYGVTFTIATKNSVEGPSRQPVYNWLFNATDNGVMSATVTRDFQKFLIGKDGSLIGMYAASVSPLDSTIQNALMGK